MGARHRPCRRHLSGRTCGGTDALDFAIRETLDEHGVDLVVLSGYLKRVGPKTVARFRNRILNIHPAPLPRFGGRGMYGRAVHEAILAAGLTTTDITVHLVDDIYDHGPVVHRHPVPIAPATDAVALQERVGAAEPAVYIEVLRRITSGDIDLDDVATSSRR